MTCRIRPAPWWACSSGRANGIPRSGSPRIESDERKHSDEQGTAKITEEAAGLRRAGHEIYDLELYISGATAHSRAAVANIKAVAEKYLKGRYRLVVTDLYQEPAKAREEQIIVVPMLVKRRPLPLQRIVGDLASEEHVLLGLQLDPETGREGGADVTKRSLSASRSPSRATQMADLRARADEAESVLRAMQSGQVDAIVRFGPAGNKVFTLEGAEHVYRVMVESMGEGAVTLASDGMILYANRRFAEMVKKDLQDVIGASMPQFIAPASIDAFEALLREAGSSAGSCKGTIELLQSDGKKLAANITLHGLGSEASGNMVAVVTDLSEVKRATAARDQLAHIVDSAMDAIIGEDLDGIVTSWNKGAEILYGYTAAEIIGKNIVVLLPPERKQEDKALVAKIVSGGAVERYETVRITKSGKTIDVLVSLSPIADESGAISGVSKIVHDISERKRLERTQDNFVSTVSHELRTPLTSISASMALLTGGAVGQINGRAQGFIDIAYRNAERLGRLVNDILDAEKLQSGKVEFHLEVIKLEDHVGNAVDAIRPLANEKGIALVADFGAQPHQVAADPDRLSQAVTNILSNAIKFSPAGAEVVVRIDENDDSVRISVIDHGPGIPEEFRKRLFERFAQADDSSTRSQTGTGLGLNIAREIIERLGGHISFESVVGSGTTFHIDLPTYHAAKQNPLATSRLDQAHAQTMSR